MVDREAAAAGGPAMLSYCVDTTDRITEIDGAWDEFALANGAPQLTRDLVLGKELSTFIAGREARELTQMLFGQARLGRSVSLGFRCDSPSERRHLRMTLSPAGAEAIRCATTLERAEPRARVRLLDDSSPRSQDLLSVCSWCKKIRMPDGSWSEVEVAVEALGLFGAVGLPQLSHGVCEPCREELRKRGRSGPC
jgi:hypothetical protein